MTTTFVGPLPILLCQTIFPPAPLSADRPGGDCKVYRRILGEPIRRAECAGCRLFAALIVQAIIESIP
jgi:hypothetical protein